MRRSVLWHVWTVFTILLGSHAASAQTRTVTGTVFNAISSTPIPGIQVRVKGVAGTVRTSTAGRFTLSVPDTMRTIAFAAFPGMETVEIRSTARDAFDIYLSEIDIIDLSFEELLRVKVNVSTTMTETVFHTPSTVSVIDREMLRNYNYLSVAEMLRTAVGMDIYQTNNDDNVATSRGVLQNYYANKVLVMIENIPTYQPIYGNTNLDRLDVNDIERIEVLKGPASVLYGSNAYMGVVNIVLRKSKDGDVNVRLGTGYRRFGSAGANITMAENDFTLFISANSGFEAQKPYELTGRRQDVFRGDTVISFQRELTSNNVNLLGTYKAFTFLMNHYEYQHTFMGINPSFISGGGKPMNDRGSLIALKYLNTLGAGANILVDVAYDFFKRDYASNQDGSTALMLSGDRMVGRAKVNYELAAYLDAETGFDLERRMRGEHVTWDVLQDTLIRSNLRDTKDIDEASAFGQLHLKTPFVNLLGGLRYTSNSFAGSNLSARISAVKAIGEAQSMKLIFGQSFRAPTMLELFFDHPTVMGNLNLKAETANSLELAYVYGGQKQFVQMLVYYNKLEQLIQRFTPASGPPSEYRNISSFEGYGFEFEGKYQDPKIVNAFINYNYMAGSGREAESNYRHVPKHTVKFGLNKGFGDFFASVNGYAISSVIGNPRLNTEIGAQFMLDLHVGYRHRLTKNNVILEHSLSVKNITAADMLIPEYIRQTDNINSQATAAFGTRIIYVVTVSL